ncbi:MAG TPA: TatD family hydrolase [Ferruginibacter sp.]|nr:TatD family hydrolase [Ferruginibacter sp.]
MLIDTHCHLYVKEFETDIESVIRRAEAAGVERFYMPAIDHETNQALINLEERFPGKCFAMMGLHPCSVNEHFQVALDEVSTWLEKRKFAAIGETGLDFYWDKTFVKEQYYALEKQIEWAIQYQLPIVLHTRNATQETVDVIKKYAGTGLKGIFHCFGGSLDEAQQIIELGFYLGIGGVVTYKNAGLAEVLEKLDLANIVLETDSPYLSPVPFRGKRNESAYLKNITEKLAGIKQVSVEEVARITTGNAREIFK